MPEDLRPKNRSALRLACGTAYYTARRYAYWAFGGVRFAKTQQEQPLGWRAAAHSTPLLRKLKDVDMQYQYNKIINLKLACACLDGVILRPGETFSYWKCIGHPTRRKGYVDGMILFCGTFGPGVGGGLCQLSNLIYWMTLHTPLTVAERYRHSYDVFPDSNRTQPFGSGATCVYPYRDLMIRNDTHCTWQLCVRVGETDLEGEWRCSEPTHIEYKVIEKQHRFEREWWGGFSRHNELWRICRDLDTSEVGEEYITENHAITMYAPLLPGAGEV